MYMSLTHYRHLIFCCYPVKLCKLNFYLLPIFFKYRQPFRLHFALVIFFPVTAPTLICKQKLIKSSLGHLPPHLWKIWMDMFFYFRILPPLAGWTWNEPLLCYICYILIIFLTLCTKQFVLICLVFVFYSELIPVEQTTSNLFCYPRL